MSSSVVPFAHPAEAIQLQRQMTPVLIADDNHDLADLLVHVIKAMGYDAIAVCDGQEAVWWCNAFRPRLVILDINMPRLDGCQAAFQIRQSGNCPACITAHTALGLDNEPLKSGRELFEYVLTKPVDFGKLSEILLDTLGEPQMSTSAELTDKSSARD